MLKIWQSKQTKKFFGACSKVVQPNQLRDKSSRDLFQIDSELADRYILGQVLFMHATERAQEIAHRCPQSLAGVHMHLSLAVTVIIPRPLSLTMVYCAVNPNDVIIPLPFIGEDHRLSTGKSADMLFQYLPRGLMNDPQSYLPALPANRPHDRRTIVLVGPVPPSLVRTPPRRIGQVGVFLPFSPFS